MAIEAAELGELTAGFMDEVEDRYGEEATLGIVAVVVEVNVDEDDGPGYTEILYRCSDTRRWIQQGLFLAAQRAVLAGTPNGDSEDDDE